MRAAAELGRKPAPASEPSADEEPVARNRPRTRVLVVDDDPRNLLALSEVLEDLAHVVQASSGEEALRFLLRDEFAVIILDVLMPGLDGYETAKLVRSRKRSRDTPIIFLTAINKEDAHLLRGYDSGAVDYVFKPFEPMILRSKVRVFVSLYEKTSEIEEKAKREQRLLQQTLQAQMGKARSDEALKAAEERQALILAALPLAVYAEEAADGIRAPRFVAGDVAGLTGFTAEDFVADHLLWHTRLHPEDAEREAPAAVADGAARTSEYRWRHADGEYRYFVDQSVALPDRPGLTAGTLRDVTEHRRLQDQLLQAQKLDAVGKLTGGIAHDFNNLLASVLSGLALLERRVEMDDGARQVLDMTRHAAQQGSQLVNRLLSFSRRQNLQPKVVQLADVGKSLNAMLNPVLGGMVRLSWDVEPRLAPALVDVSQLELAVMNLVLNARDAMPSGGTITIRIANRSLVETTEDLAPGEFVVVTVSDTGHGIPHDLVTKVTEPFFTTKDIGKGTGLGLSTAYGFARQSGGTLRIESAEGSGTSVEIWLPRATASAEPEENPAAAAQLPPPAEASTVKPTILLVDDSASLRSLTQFDLSDAGFEVVSAAGGAEALTMIEREPSRFDLIVTDFAMPLMSGLEVIRYARNMRPNWPAVIITGYADSEGLAKRPADVPLITKPFSRQALLQAIASVTLPQVQRTTGSAQAAQQPPHDA